jgi:BT_3987-like, N-terminal domain/BT_3044-like, C-terminal
MRRKSLLIPFLFITGMVFFTSCEKDFVFGDIDPNTERVIVEFSDSQSGGTSSLEYTTSLIQADLTEIRLFPRSVANGDVKVKVIVNPTVVADFNSENGTSFVSVPAAAYSLESNEIVLNQEKRRANIKINIRPSLVTGGSFAIGLSIAEVTNGEVSELHHNVLVEVKVKNAYEGEYVASGTMVVYNGSTNTSPIAATYPIDEVKLLSTVDNTTVETLIGYSDFTGAYMYLTVNPSTNQVTVSPSLTAPTFPAVNNNGTCVYNPATNSFTLNYLYVNAAGNLREIHEVLVKQ